MQDLITRLLCADVYDHPVGAVTVIQTHISWVLLTGSYAYKIKKPVRLGFVDFESLEKRHHFCKREVELNSCFSSDLYVGVVAIRLYDSSLSVNGECGQVVEYAVKMRQFQQDALFINMLEQNRLEQYHIDSLADVLSLHHRDAGIITADSSYGSIEQIAFWNEDNLSQIESLEIGKADRKTFHGLATKVHEEFERDRSLFKYRHLHGFIRDCHGDLHLGNILWYGSNAVVFDRIEFNDELRWIDVVNDAAFVIMNLLRFSHNELAWRFLNRYLRNTGDYGGVGVLRFYVVYRALVRAKVALLSIAQTDLNSDKISLRNEYRNLVSLANGMLASKRCEMIIMCGYSGSGKTTHALEKAREIGAVVIHSDLERKRLFGIGETEKSDSSLNKGIYSAKASRKVYSSLAEGAVTAIKAGYSVVIDAAFLRSSDRDSFRKIAQKHGAGFRILLCEADPVVLRSRLDRRERAGGNMSEAGRPELEHQLRNAQLPGPGEECFVERTGEKFGLD